MRTIFYLGIILQFLVGCQEKASEENSTENETQTNEALDLKQEFDDPSKNITSFSDFVDMVVETDLQYDKIKHELGNRTETFSYSYPFKNIEEAISLLTRLNMLEIDDYHPEKIPLSSGRSISFNLNDDDPVKIKDVFVNDKPIIITLDERSDSSKQYYSGPTSTIKSYEYYDEVSEYSDNLSFTMEYKDGELIGFETRSVLNGYLSDDELISSNLDNSMSLEDLRAADSTVENTIYALCNGYQSVVEIAKIGSGSFSLKFTITTHRCAL